MNAPTHAVLIGRPVTLSDVRDVAQRKAAVALDASVREALIGTRRELLDDIAKGHTIYGVNTGFGALSDTRIPADRIDELQRNLLRSHACGVGPCLSDEIVRALLMLRAHTLSLGASGVSPTLVDAILDLLRHDVLPIVPAQGSVGASGDLAPLAHLALPLIGEGEAWVHGQRMSGADALRAAGLQPYACGPKDGLSLINGTQVTTAIGALCALAAGELVATADVVGALTLDAGLNTTVAFDPRIHAGKPHPGQLRTAEIVLQLVTGSELAASHADCGEVQDAYCIRCMPQVHGAVRGALHYVANALRIEINSFTDNPLVLRREGGGYDVVSGGNFHASTVAIPIDHLAAALTVLSTISERRLDRFMSPASSRGLPPFLAADPGVESGFMMAQVTAAALASECKAHAYPASVDTIPTSAGKEDHVSMGPIAARKLERIVDNASKVLAIEAMAAARALDLRVPKTTPRLQAVYGAIRRYVAPHEGDRSLSAEIEALAEAIRRGELREAAGLPAEL